MPWLPFYANASDVEVLRRWLADQDAVAFVVRPEPGRLVATSQIDFLPDGRYCLWSVESGPLPHYRLRRGLLGSRQVCDTVSNPWTGWEETVTSASGEPWFGGGHPGIFWLNVQTRSIEKAGGIGLSGFEWIGSRWGPAPACCTEWWKRLRSWMAKNSKRLVRSPGPGDKVFAMYGAHAEIAAGMSYDINPKIP
jgi:hypothetical protein